MRAWQRHGGEWFALSTAARRPVREIFERQVLKSQLDTGAVSP